MQTELTLVTGGGGFLGRHVVRALRAQGHAVRVLDVQDAPQELAADWVVGSVTDPDTVRTVLGDVARVIHLAAIPHLWCRDRSRFDAVNAAGTQVLLQAAASQGVSAFVHVSSLTTRVAGPPGGPQRQVAEADLPPLHDMLGPYPRSKWLAEDHARAARRNGLPVRIAVPTMPLGPGDFGFTPPTQMVLDFVCGRTPAFMESVMNVADVRDMATQIVAMLETEVPESGCFVGGVNLKLSALLQSLEAASGVKMPTTPVPGIVAEMAALVDEGLLSRLTGKPPKAPLTGVRLARRPVAFDMTLARSLLPAPEYDLQMTLEDVLAWFDQQNLWHRAT